jgi:hypothetical protein
LKPNWAVRRTTMGRSDAARRWDQAYLHIIKWAAQQSKEDRREATADESGNLRPGLYLTTDARPERRSAGGEAEGSCETQGLDA